MQHDESAEGKRRALLTAAMTSILAPMAVVAADEAPTTLHIVNYLKQGSCGQADVPSKDVFFARNLGGMQDGPCSKDGHSVAQGTAPGIREKDKQRTNEFLSKNRSST